MTADHVATPVTDASIEVRLADALAFGPPASAANRIEGRMAALRAQSEVGTATATPGGLGNSAADLPARATGGGDRPVSGRPRPWTTPRPGQLPRRRVVASLALAFMVVAGAGGGLASLYDNLAGSSGALRVQWDNAIPLSVSDVAAGYRVTVERAYADANDVMLAISIVDAKNQLSSQVGLTVASLVDDAGREYDQTLGESSPNGTASAANLLWFRTTQPQRAGERSFQLRLDTIDVRDLSTPPPSEDPNWMPWHKVPGPWSFQFALNVKAGSTPTGASEAKAGGVVVRLDRLSATDATIFATLSVEAAATKGSGWFPVGAFVHKGVEYPITMGNTGKGSAGPISIEALSGTADRSGAWELRIDELLGDDGMTQARLQGPWRLKFELP